MRAPLHRYWSPSSIIDYVMGRSSLKEVCDFKPIRNALLVVLDNASYTASAVLDRLELNQTDIQSVKVSEGHAEIVFEDYKRVAVVKALIEKQNTDQFPTWKHASVMDMSIRSLIDGGARSGRQAGATGQTVEGLSFKAMIGLENALIPNFFVTLASSGDDAYENYNHYGSKSLREKSQLEHTGYFDADGVYYKIHFDHGGDGKARRGFQGGISPLGIHPNDTCYCETSAGLEVGHVCQVRVLEDVFLNEVLYDERAEESHGAMRCTLEQISFGGLLAVCTAFKDSARMLWHSRNLCEILPMFARKKRSDILTENDIDVFVGPAFTVRRGQLAETGEWVYSREQQFVAVKNWVKVKVQYIPLLAELKGKNEKVKGTRIVTGLQKDLDELPCNSEGEPKYFAMVKFLDKAEKKIKSAQQSGCKIDNKKTQVLDLPAALEKSKSDLLKGQAIVHQQQAKAAKLGPEASASWSRAVFAVDPATRMLGKVDLAMGKIDEALTAVKTIEVDSDQVQNAEGEQSAALLPSADALNIVQKLCVDRKTAPSDFAMYSIGNDALKKQLVNASAGMHKPITFETRPMLLGLLHLFCMRGWGTLMCCMGVLAWSKGIGNVFAKTLSKNGVPCHYFMVKGGAMKFGTIKSRGYDSLKVFFSPEKYFENFKPDEQRVLCFAVYLWGALWFILANPFLMDTFFTDIPLDQRRAHAESVVRRMSEALTAVLAGLFAGTKSFLTTTMHQVLRATVLHFCDLHQDMSWGREDVVEAAQPLARQLLSKCQCYEDKNTAMIYRYVHQQIIASILSP